MILNDSCSRKTSLNIIPIKAGSGKNAVLFCQQRDFGDRANLLPLFCLTHSVLRAIVQNYIIRRIGNTSYPMMMMPQSAEPPFP